MFWKARFSWIFSFVIKFSPFIFIGGCQRPAARHRPDERCFRASFIRSADMPSGKAISDRVPPSPWKFVDSQKMLGHLLAQSVKDQCTKSQTFYESLRIVKVYQSFIKILPQNDDFDIKIASVCKMWTTCTQHVDEMLSLHWCKKRVNFVDLENLVFSFIFSVFMRLFILASKKVANLPFTCKKRLHVW